MSVLNVTARGTLQVQTAYELQRKSASLHRLEETYRALRLATFSSELCIYASVVGGRRARIAMRRARRAGWQHGRSPPRPRILPPPAEARRAHPLPPPPAPPPPRTLSAPSVPGARASPNDRWSLRFLHLHCDIEIQFSIERPSTGLFRLGAAGIFVCEQIV